jgi:hypothetical protein
MLYIKNERKGLSEIISHYAGDVISAYVHPLNDKEYESAIDAFADSWQIIKGRNKIINEEVCIIEFKLIQTYFSYETQ